MHHLHRPSSRQPSAHEVIQLRGELNERNASPTAGRLLAAINRGPSVLEIDLRHVTYLSPDACTALFEALIAARARGVRLTVTHADERTQSTLRRLGLERALLDNNGT